MNYKKISFISMLVVVAVILIATVFFDFSQAIGATIITGILAGLFGFKSWERKKNASK